LLKLYIASFDKTYAKKLQRSKKLNQNTDNQNNSITKKQLFYQKKVKLSCFLYFQLDIYTIKGNK